MRWIRAVVSVRPRRVGPGEAAAPARSDAERTRGCTSGRDCSRAVRLAQCSCLERGAGYAWSSRAVGPMASKSVAARSPGRKTAGARATIIPSQTRRSARRNSPCSRISIGARCIAVPSGGPVSTPRPIGRWSPPGLRLRSPSAAPPPRPLPLVLVGFSLSSSFSTSRPDATAFSISGASGRISSKSISSALSSAGRVHGSTTAGTRSSTRSSGPSTSTSPFSRR